MSNFILTITMLLLITTSVNAEIYQWTDKNGNVHFSDKPTANSNSKKLSLKESNNIKFSQPNNLDWLAEYVQQNTLKQKQQAQQKITQQKRRAVCDYWRSRVQIYQQAGRLAIMSPQGKRTYVDDKQRQQQVDKLKQNLNKFCR